MVQNSGAVRAHAHELWLPCHPPLRDAAAAASFGREDTSAVAADAAARAPPLGMHSYAYR